MKTFKQFLTEEKDQNINESNWDEVYNSIEKSYQLLQTADDMWNGPAVQEKYKDVIKTIEASIKESQKTIQLLKKYIIKHTKTFKNYRYKGYLIANDDDYGVVVYDKNGIDVLIKNLHNHKEAEKFIDKQK